MKFEKTILENGIRVISEEHSWANTIHVGVYIENGTKHELEGEMGMAHLTEHMVFKGTKDSNALEIVANIEKSGGEINAHTSREYTCYNVQTLKSGFQLALKTLLDLTFNATFPESDFDREKEVVQQEIDMSSDNIEDCIFDLYFEKTFVGHPLSRNILGTKESLDKIKRKNLLRYYNEGYQNSRIIVAVVGAISHAEVLKIIRELKLDQLYKNEPSKDYLLALEPQTFKHHSLYEWVHRPSEQTHVLAGMPSVSFIDPLRFESYILSAALGGGMTSRLYQIIREDKGWAYSVYSYLQSFLEGGSLALYIGTAADKALPVLEVINNEIKKLKQSGLTTEELNLYKTQVESSILMGADDLENRMNSIGVNEMIFKRYRPIDEVIEDIRKVSINSLDEFIKTNLDASESMVLVMGDGNSSQQEEIRSYKFSF